MSRVLLIALGFATALAVTSDASAQRQSRRFAALERLNNPFGVLSDSRFGSDRFGLPLYLQSFDDELEVVESSTEISTAAADDEPSADSVPATDDAVVPTTNLGSFGATVSSSTTTTVGTIGFTPVTSAMTRPPFRPRVRSPFRPPPRPSLP